MGLLLSRARDEVGPGDPARQAGGGDPACRGLPDALGLSDEVVVGRAAPGGGGGPLGRRRGLGLGGLGLRGRGGGVLLGPRLTVAVEPVGLQRVVQRCAAVARAGGRGSAQPSFGRWAAVPIWGSCAAGRCWGTGGCGAAKPFAPFTCGGSNWPVEAGDWRSGSRCCPVPPLSYPWTPGKPPVAAGSFGPAWPACGPAWPGCPPKTSERTKPPLCCGGVGSGRANRSPCGAPAPYWSCPNGSCGCRPNPPVFCGSSRRGAGASKSGRANSAVAPGPWVSPRAGTAGISVVEPGPCRSSWRGARPVRPLSGSSWPRGASREARGTDGCAFSSLQLGVRGCGLPPGSSARGPPRGGSCGRRPWSASPSPLPRRFPRCGGCAGAEGRVRHRTCPGPAARCPARRRPAARSCPRPADPAVHRVPVRHRLRPGPAGSARPVPRGPGVRARRPAHPDGRPRHARAVRPAVPARRPAGRRPGHRRRGHRHRRRHRRPGRRAGPPRHPRPPGPRPDRCCRRPAGRAWAAACGRPGRRRRAA